MARLALAHAAGIALPLLGATFPPALLVLGLLTSLVLLWRRPWPLGILAVAFVAGTISGRGVVRGRIGDCRLSLPTAWSGTVEGRFTVRPVAGTSLPFEWERGAPGGCRGEVRAVVRRGAPVPSAGERIRVTASWEGRAYAQPGWADRAGVLWLGNDLKAVPGGGVRGWLLNLRGAVQERIFDLWGERLGPMVEALVLARREHLDADLRDAFSRSGTAHMLAISGFHVGVVAVLLLGLLRLVGTRRLRAECGAVLGCWAYVLGIGAPQAAVRAAVLLSLLVVARLRGRPVMELGALGAGLLLLLVAEPGWLGSVGFQLSFAGTAGLVLMRRPVVDGLSAAWRRWRGAASSAGSIGGPGRRTMRALIEGVGAGVAASVATLPLVAWHFDRVSLVGIPATLIVTPVVAAAIPGILVSLLLSTVSGGAGAFLAGGTGLILGAMARFVTWCAALPGAAVWVSREGLVAAVLTLVVAAAGLRLRYAGRIRPSVRRLVAVSAAASVVVVLPLLPSRRLLEVHMIDVGQGDAVALRLPSRRWILVDTGPRSETFDAGARRVVPYLRRHGVSELEAVVLTHPHLDHIGGAPAVLRGVDVRGILDPSRPTGSNDYLAVLNAAVASGSSWWPARAHLTLDIDGVRLSFLHPDSSMIEAPRVPDLNDLSIVVLVQWADAAVLLTGDASAEIERGFVEALPRLSVLKVGHHGSRTSTSPELLERTHPSVALVPVGEGNSFGHPHPAVMQRLREAGVEIYRTDRDGDIRATLRRDGSVEVRRER